MSIVAYVGLPGSGKSYSAVQQQILPALKLGLVVVTNLPLRHDLVEREVGGQCRDFPIEAVRANPELIFDHVPKGCLLVLDEVWRLFPAGLKANQVPEPFRTIFAEHRHHVDAAGRSTQIVLVTQDLAQISAFARQLVETTYRTVKLSMVGMNKRFRTDVFNGPVTGPNPPLAQRLRQTAGRYAPEVYRFYVSHQFSDSATEGADESVVDKRANVLRRPIILAAPVVVLGLLWYGAHGIWGHNSLLNASARKERSGSGALAGGQVLAGGFAQSALVGEGGGVVRRPAPPVWRLTGTVSAAGEVAYAVLEDGSRVVRVGLAGCLRMPFTLACLAPDGRYWDWSGVSYPGFSGPVVRR